MNRLLASHIVLVAGMALAAAGCRDLLGIHELQDLDASANDSGLGAGDATEDASSTLDALVNPGGDGSQGGTPDSGVSCTPGGNCAANDCQPGTWICDGGVHVCDTTKAAPGTACGVVSDAGVEVCSEAGQCVSCNAGVDCSDPSVPCVTKSIDCSSGVPVCRDVGTIADGTLCGSGDYCSMGECTPCQVGGACAPAANPCHAGKITACSASGAATCTDQGTNAVAGTSCTATGGASAVCDGSGACVLCSQGAQCNPPGNTCQAGTQACGSGAQCTNLKNVREGLTCGASGSTVCHNGSCVACDGTSCSAGCCNASGCVTSLQSTTVCGNAGAACRSCPGPTVGAGSATCSDNTCGIACSGATSLLCGTTCVDPSKDPNCGTCGHSCSASGSYVCSGSSGQCTCVPKTTAQACQSNNCGTAPDGCGGTINCGTCTAPKACMVPGGATAGVCGCTPQTEAQACGSSNCGSASDGCGGTISCGSCSNGHTCSQSSGPGTCVCPGGLTDCSGTCVNKSTDANNCGTCGNACPRPNGDTPGCCGGSCVDFTTDPNNCTGCGVASGTAGCDYNGIHVGVCIGGGVTECSSTGAYCFPKSRWVGIAVPQLAAAPWNGSWDWNCDGCVGCIHQNASDPTSPCVGTCSQGVETGIPVPPPSSCTVNCSTNCSDSCAYTTNLNATTAPGCGVTDSTVYMQYCDPNYCTPVSMAFGAQSCY